MELLRITLYRDDGILLKEVSPTSRHNCRDMNAVHTNSALLSGFPLPLGSKFSKLSEYIQVAFGNISPLS